MYLWKKDDSGEWIPERREEESASLGAAELRRFHSPLGGERWCLMSSGDGARVNGEVPALGIQVLEHQDEIRVLTNIYFISTEKRPTIELASLDGLFCGRCRKPIPAETPMVRCPGCGASCHQSEKLPCFTYAAACPHCDQPTDLDGGFRFHPGEEGW